MSSVVLLRKLTLDECENNHRVAPTAQGELPRRRRGNDSDVSQKDAHDAGVTRLCTNLRWPAMSTEVPNFAGATHVTIEDAHYRAPGTSALEPSTRAARSRPPRSHSFTPPIATVLAALLRPLLAMSWEASTPSPWCP